MKKNFAITILVITVLVLGSWIIFDGVRSQNSASALSCVIPSSGQIKTDVLNLSHNNLTSVGSHIYDQTQVT